jgi:hypothetical protein
MAEYWVVILVAVIAATPGVLAYLNQHKRLKAEVGKAKANGAIRKGSTESSGAIRVAREVWKISEEYKERVKLLEKKIEELEAELKDTTREVGDLHGGIVRLLAQLIEHNITPVWSPARTSSEVD